MSALIMLLDGNSLINRAYYGLNSRNPLTAPDGTPTGAVYAFLNMYLRYVEDLKPDYACAAFDRKEPTFRHAMFDGYKSGRKPMPDDLAIQIPLLKEIIDQIGLPQIELAGYEADDILGTISRQAREAGFKVCLVTGDKDSFQLIDSQTTVLQPLTRGGQSETVLVDEASIQERYQVRPSQLIDIKALMGDPSDTIPGVRGIGEKGAVALIRRYGSLDGVFEHTGELATGVAAKLVRDREMAYLSYRLSEIDRHVPIQQDINQWRLREPAKAELARLFGQYGFKSLFGRFDLPAINSDPLGKDNDASDRNSDSPVELISDPQTFVDNASAHQWLVIDQADAGHCLVMADQTLLYTSTSQLTPLLDSLCSKQNSERLPDESSTNNKRSFHVAVYDYKHLLRNAGFDPFPVPPHDIMTAGYLLNQIDGKPDFIRLVQSATGEIWKEAETGTELQQMDLVDLHDETSSMDAKKASASGLSPTARTVAYHRMSAIRQVAQLQQTILSADESLFHLMTDLEMPLTEILAEMESVGFCLDQQELERLSESMQHQIVVLQKDIYEKCGLEFNLNSPKQLGQILFEQLGLPTGKKRTGGNFSTDAEELERLRFLHPAVPLIIEHRFLSKLNSTFIEGLKRSINPLDGRVHTTFSQVQTATGRLSSTDPNLQNIPIRREAGSAIRKVFIAPEGCVLLDADYSQIELRLLAHLSQDPAMLEAFNQDQDIHTNTACSIFERPAHEITPDQRAVAKTVNFSIVYGISDFGLARDLGVSVKTAHDYIQGYNSKYPVVRSYLESLKQSAYDKGYVETMFGRRRYLPELKSGNRNVRQFGERAAMNAPVQGSAADLIKMAMVRTDRELKQAGLRGRLILQVHDELIMEVPEKEAKQTAVLLRECMEQVVSLSVRMQAEVHQGKNWAECK